MIDDLQEYLILRRQLQGRYPPGRGFIHRRGTRDTSQGHPARTPWHLSQRVLRFYSAETYATGPRVTRYRTAHLVDTMIRHYYAGSLCLRIATRLGVRRWLPVVNCNTDTAMAAATTYLTTVLELPYLVIDSSPGHAWLLLDHVCTKPQALAMLHYIPGNDRAYVQACRTYNAVGIRSFPQAGYIPQVGAPDRQRHSVALTRFARLLRLWYAHPTIRWLAAQQRAGGQPTNTAQEPTPHDDRYAVET